MLSRRELLGINDIKGSIRAIMSVNAKTDEAQQRDRMVELFAEGGLGIVIAVLALTGAQDKYTAVSVTSERPLPRSRSYVEGQRQIDSLGNIVGPLARRIATVSSTWNRFSRTETVNKWGKVGESCTGTGSSEVCTDVYGWIPTPETVWHEPPELVALGISRQSLSNWRRLLESARNGLGELAAQSTDSFDLSQGEAVLDFREETLDMGISNILSVILYGASGAGMIKYEEWSKRLMLAIGQIYSTGIDQKYAIKRRSVLKLGAVSSGALLVRQLQRALGEGNQDVLADVQNHTAATLMDIQKNPEKPLNGFMTMQVRELAALLGTVNNIAQQALNLSRVTEYFDIGQWNSTIRPEVESLFYDSQAAIARFTEFFNFDPRTGSYVVPAQLLQLAGSTAGTREILRYAGARRSELKIAHPLHALLLAGGFAGIAALGEKVLFPAIDRAVDQQTSSDNTF